MQGTAPLSPRITMRFGLSNRRKHRGMSALAKCCLLVLEPWLDDSDSPAQQGHAQLTCAHPTKSTRESRPEAAAISHSPRPSSDGILRRRPATADQQRVAGAYYDLPGKPQSTGKVHVSTQEEALWIAGVMLQCGGDVGRDQVGCTMLIGSAGPGTPYGLAVHRDALPAITAQRARPLECPDLLVQLVGVQPDDHYTQRRHIRCGVDPEPGKVWPGQVDGSLADSRQRLGVSQNRTHGHGENTGQRVPQPSRPPTAGHLRKRTQQSGGSARLVSNNGYRRGLAGTERLSERPHTRPSGHTCDRRPGSYQCPSTTLPADLSGTCGRPRSKTTTAKVVSVTSAYSKRPVTAEMAVHANRARSDGTPSEQLAHNIRPGCALILTRTVNISMATDGQA